MSDIAIPMVERRDLARRPVDGELVRVGLRGAPGWKLAVKRALDAIGATILLLLLAPVFVLVALAVRLDSPGPVLFRQERVGQHGRSFAMLKFRSMRSDALSVRRELAGANEADGVVFKIRRDPRITRVGRVLRKLSLDELPQLVQVLRGEMSLVGPRPPLPDEVALYGPREQLRLLAKPGLTCFWQVSGRSDLGFGEWIDLDLRYLREWSLGLDLVLLVRTIPAVLLGRGAY